MRASSVMKMLEMLCRCAAVIVFALVLAIVGGCKRDESAVLKNGDLINQELAVFHAGSLSVPFRELTDRFTKDNPGVMVLAEAAGSRDTARKVSDLGRSCDVLGSADYRVVENLLMPDHASFNIRFMANEMVIAGGKKSRKLDEIDGQTWPDVLLHEDISFGRADPNRDPCGYRTEMVFQLAEKHYKRAGLAAKLSAKHGKTYIRPKETDLLALLEVGEIDYLFIYKSVAVQHGLHIVSLPDEVNLASPELAEFYRSATVEVTGAKPGEMITRVGEPIVYSVTIPTSAENRAMAEEYLRLLFSPLGRGIMEHTGHRVLPKPLADHIDKVPESLRGFCEASPE